MVEVGEHEETNPITPKYLKVNVPNPATYLNHAHVSMWFGVAPRTNTEIHVFKRDWTICSKYHNHSKLDTQHNWERWRGETFMTIQ